MNTKNRTTIELHPISVQATELSSNDDWLNNNSLELMNAKFDKEAVDLKNTNLVIYHCDQLQIHIENQRFFIEQEMSS